MPNICQFFICLCLIKIIHNFNITSLKKNDNIVIPTKSKTRNIITQQPSYTSQDEYSIDIEENDSSEESHIDIGLLDGYVDINLKDVL